MNSQLQIFDFNQSPVRVIDQGGQSWFVARDVCQVLEITNSHMAVEALDGDEVNTVSITDGNRGNPNKTIISESGLYALIFKSRKPQAKAFRKWVTSEVLPTIRRTGGYSAKGVDRVQGILEKVIVDVYEGNLSLEKASAIASLAGQYRNGSKSKRVAMGAHDEDFRDFSALVAALWSRDGLKTWTGREVVNVAADEGLFDGWVTRRFAFGAAAWLGPEEAAMFGQLCDRFNGNVFDGVRFEVRGRGRGRHFILKEEK
jgi:prophage antirepressor-like protein